MFQPKPGADFTGTAVLGPDDIRHPKLKPRRVSALVEQIDLMPTLAEALGVKAPEGIPARRLKAQAEMLKKLDAWSEKTRSERD